MIAMNNHDEDANLDETNTRLDAGLRAAFGPASSELSPGGCDSIVATIDHALGIQSRVSLRDDSDGRGPLLSPHTPEVDDSEGRIGRYQLSGEIARGGVGVVIRGRDVDLGRDVAIKMLRGQHAANGAMVRRFMEEAQITGQLQHPGILPVYELGLRAGNRPYFTMKLVRGRTLAELLRDRRSATEDRRRFLNIFEHICQTMAYAHSRGVVHRDLKPSNIMVGAFGEVQVLDWGLAKVLTRDNASAEFADAPAHETVVETLRSGEDGAQSIAGSVMGTPAYMSPEQARGEIERVDERTDVFALGAILCEILTGHPPFSGTKSEIMRKASAGDLTETIERLRATDADVVLTLMSQRCMAPEPDDRPRNAGMLAEEVSGFIACLEESAQEAKVAAAAAEAKAREERRARRLTLALATSVLFAMLLIGGGFFWRADVERQRSIDATHSINAAIERTAIQLGSARATRIGNPAPWEAALAAAAELSLLVQQGSADADAIRQAESLLAELRSADAERRLLELTEDIVIRGATHSDGESWKAMDDAYIAAFRDAGIDVLNATDDEIATWIRASDHPDQLANAFELWVWTGEDLKQRFGVERYQRSLRERVAPIFLADTDPFRTRLRDQMYRLTRESNTIDIDVLRELAADPAFETAPATSLSWLGSCFLSAKESDPQGGMDVYRRAVALYPDDFLLNSDYARMLEYMGRMDEASRIYSRCVAIRRNVSGAWRALGISLRSLGNYQEAIDAIGQSIRQKPDHMPTHVDLWLTHAASGDIAGAAEVLRKAAELSDDRVEPHVMLMTALPDRSPMTRSGQLESAFRILQSARDRVDGDSAAIEQLDDWIALCERAITYRDETLPLPPEWAMPQETDDASDAKGNASSIEDKE